MPGEHRSILDEAWAAWARKEGDAALRIAVAVLEHDVGHLGAAALATELLIERSNATSLRTAASRLSGTFLARGDLPMACVMASLAGDHAAAARKAIAEAFGAGSARVQDVAPQPPPLPPHLQEIPAPLAKLAGAALTARAAKALRAHLDRDTGEAAGPVPKLPLFGAIPPAALEPLLEAWQVRLIAGGQPAIREGEEGREAFVVVHGRLRVERKGGVLAELGPGAIFGEMALVSEAPRAGSVIAEEAAQLLVARRDALEAVARRTPKLGQQLAEFCRNRMIANLILHSSILRAVDGKDRPELMARFTEKSFKVGEKLVGQGQETRSLFLVASGAVRVVRKDGDGDQLQIAVLGPGDVVGEIGLVLRRPAMADVVATHPTVALELEREQFHAAIKQHPTLLGELYELATKREDETRSVVAQEPIDVGEVVLL